MNDPIDPRRRHVLALMSALGAGAIAGCTLDGGTRTAGSEAKAAAGPLDLQRVSLPARSIDVHTHFFNASDASVIGYFTHSVNHGNPRLERFLVRMQGVLEALISIAPSAQRELDKLEAYERQKLAPEARDAMMALEENAQRDRIARAVARQMRDSGVSAEFGGGFDTDKGFQAVPRDEEQIRRLLDPDSEDSNKSLAVRGTTAAGVFRFIGCMLQYRWSSLRAFQRGHGGRGIDAAFGALVDFDHFYRDPARSPMAEQVRLHSLLARHSKGFMLPLIAYNPWVDIRTGGDRLRLLTEAVERHGFIGAKIYPPVGFMPAGNTRPLGDLDPKALNETLKRFFVECHRLGIPVMAHANSTQGRDFEADQNSRPEGWQSLIEDMAKDGKVPLVNLGHFGGNGGEGPEGSSNDWPTRFAELMARDGGRGIYGDLGNWSKLRDCRSGVSACKPALDRLVEAKAKHPILEQRLMYGSDFFMMIREVDWKRWPEDIAVAMGHTGFDLERVFRENALDCFGLRPGGANRARLERFFDGALPAWLA